MLDRRRLVGVCLPHAEFRYFVILAAELGRLAARDGYDVLHVFSQTDGERELPGVETLIQVGVAGLFLLPGAKAQLTLDRLAGIGLPTVILDRPIDDRRFSQVVVDARSAMREVGSRLIELGHRRLLLVVENQHLLVSKRRIEGLRLAIRAAGEPVGLRVLERGEQREQALARMLADVMTGEGAPTAVIGTNTVIMGWILSALREIGLAIPRQVSLVCVAEPEWARLVDPPLATLRSPARVVADQAWVLLRTAIEAGSHRPRRITVQAEFHERGSIGPP